MDINSVVAKRLRRVGKAVVAVVGAAIFSNAQAIVGPAPLEHAVWVFAKPSDPANPVSNAVARQTLIANAAASHVTSLYVSVYRSSDLQVTNSAGRRMYEDADISDLIARAHGSSPAIKVFAAYGAPDWPSLGCNGFPTQRIQEVLAYNSSPTNARFDGVILDIEPPVPPPPPLLSPPLTEADFVALLAQYDCLQQQASPLPVGAAIRFGWKDLVTFKGLRKPFYQHALDLFSAPSSPVVVMGYRDFAGTSLPASDGIVASDADQVAYAFQYRFRSVLAGLETSDPAVVGILGKETFFEEGQTVLNNVAQAVANQFGFRSGLGGFAIHNYGGLYLSGASTKWPAVNASFPRYWGAASVDEIATPAGSPVTVTTAGTVNNTNVALTFQSVTAVVGSSSNTYVTALDATGLAPLPANYVSIGGLTFDISTTASFAGPVTVCFSNMNVGTVDFSTLRVLHYTAAGIADETILSGPYAPNAATRTVCASTSSFSPFRIGQCIANTGNGGEARGLSRETNKPKTKCKEHTGD